MITCREGKDGKKYYFKEGKRVSAPTTKSGKVKKVTPCPKKLMVRLRVRPYVDYLRSFPSGKGLLQLYQEGAKKFNQSYQKHQNYEWVWSSSQNKLEWDLNSLLEEKKFPVLVVYSTEILRQVPVSEIKPSLLSLVKRWANRTDLTIHPLPLLQPDPEIIKQLSSWAKKLQKRWKVRIDPSDSPLGDQPWYYYNTPSAYREFIRGCNKFLKMGEVPTQDFLERHTGEDIIDTIVAPLVKRWYKKEELDRYLQKRFYFTENRKLSSLLED